MQKFSFILPSLMFQSFEKILCISQDRQLHVFNFSNQFKSPFLHSIGQTLPMFDFVILISVIVQDSCIQTIELAMTKLAQPRPRCCHTDISEHKCLYHDRQGQDLLQGWPQNNFVMIYREVIYQNYLKIISYCKKANLEQATPNELYSMSIYHIMHVVVDDGACPIC